MKIVKKKYLHSNANRHYYLLTFFHIFFYGVKKEILRKNSNSWYYKKIKKVTGQLNCRSSTATHRKKRHDGRISALNVPPNYSTVTGPPGWRLVSPADNKTPLALGGTRSPVTACVINWFIIARTRRHCDAAD